MSTAKIIKFERLDTPPPAEVKRMDSGFTRIPNDLLRAANRCLKGNQHKLFFAVVEKTFGFNKTHDDVTISQLADCAGIERQNASPAFHELVVKKVITATAGRFGFIVSINPVSVWNLTEKERLKFRRTSENHTSEIQTNVLNPDVSASEIQTHKRQLPKDINIYSSTQDENADAENQTFAIADAMATESAGEDADCSTHLPEGKKSKQAADNRKRFEAIAGEFNRVFADCQGVRKVNLAATQTNAKRMRLIPKAWAIAKQRIATWADENGLIGGEAPSGKHCIEWFGLYFEQCRQDPFVTGEGGRSKGHENWKPGFEYLLRAEVMEARVLEGA